MKTRNWYRFQNAAEDHAVADLYIFGDIGKSWWDDDTIPAKQFIDDLRALPASTMKARVHVNSLGGDVFEGVAIANALRAWAVNGRTVETIVEGIAASIASVVIQAGSTIKIADNAMIFVHLPWTIGMGNAKDMRKMASDLEAIAGSITATYQWHSSLSEEELLALMEAETWLDAEEAIENGFATEKVEALQIAASLDPRSAAKVKVPEKFKARVDALVVKPEPAAPSPSAPVAATALEVIRACAAAGCSDEAEALVASGATLPQVQAKVAEVKSAREKETTRTSGIRALCDKAQCPELIDGYVRGGMPVDEVRAHLVIVTAKVDNKDIDGTLVPNGKKAHAGVIDVFGDYAALAKKH